MSQGGMWRGGFDRWADWEAEPKVWLLGGSGFIFDPTHDTIADIAGTELAVTGYARQALAGAVAGWHGDTYSNVALYGAYTPSWAGLGAGETIASLVLALDGTDDASSGLICWWPVNEPSDIGDIILNLDPWEYSSVPLPGGDVDTRKVHEAISWIQT